jgi:hypothetical protein
LLALLVIGIWAVPFIHLVQMQEFNTLSHIAFAQQMSETGVLFPGHFLFHVSTIAIHTIAPISWQFANVIVLLGYRLLLAGIIWFQVRRAIRSRDSASDAVLAIFLTVGLMFAGAISFLTWPAGNYYLGYLVPNIYVSQTLVVLQPLAQLSFFAVIRVFFNRTDWTPSGLHRGPRGSIASWRPCQAQLCHGARASVGCPSGMEGTRTECDLPRWTWTLDDLEMAAK